MKLGRSVSVYGAGSIVFKGCGQKLPSGFRCMIPADTGLRVAFQLVESERDSLTMCLTHLLITAHKRR
jgi:hypothetical protein